MNFTSAIIRAPGNEVGRSIARTAINRVAKGSDANYVNVNGTAKRGRPAESEFSKALSFDMAGSNKASTIESRLFNLVIELENQMTYNNANNIPEDISLVTSKLNDVYEFFEFKQYDKSNVDVLKTKFFKAAQNGIDICKKYHATMLIEKTAILKSRKKVNTICAVIGVFCLFIPFFFIKGTTNLKLQIEQHGKLSNMKMHIA